MYHTNRTETSNLGLCEKHILKIGILCKVIDWSCVKALYSCCRELIKVLFDT